VAVEAKATALAASMVAAAVGALVGAEAKAATVKCFVRALRLRASTRMSLCNRRPRSQRKKHGMTYLVPGLRKSQ
jgi:hypothetical protein